jgi:plasmid stability protein
MGAIQVKHVPNDLHDALRARAAAEGMTIEDYVLGLIRKDLSRPSMREWLENLRSLEPMVGGPSSSDLVDHARAQRDDALDP